MVRWEEKGSGVRRIGIYFISRVAEPIGRWPIEYRDGQIFPTFSNLWDQMRNGVNDVYFTLAGATPSGFHSFLSSTTRRLFRTAEFEKNSLSKVSF